MKPLISIFSTILLLSMLGTAMCYNHAWPEKCIFPFKYKESWFKSCTTADYDTPWCATTLHENGHVNDWKHCSCTCYN